MPSVPARAVWVLTMVVVSGLAVAHPGHESPEAPIAHAAANAGESEVVIEVRGGYRYITSNGLPDHEPGRFPNQGNPNAIREQAYRWRVPEKPVAAAQPTSNPFGPFGVALNGVPFDPGTAEFWKRDRTSGWREEAIRPGDRGQLGMDAHHAHVQPNGAYHYHGLPTGLIERLGGPKRVLLVGYAADGFPIYASRGYRDPKDPTSEVVELRPSYRLKQGTRPSGNRGPGGEYDGKYTQDYEYALGSGDLDECNGRFAVTPEYPEGIYHYVLTRDFPNVPRMWKGTPDASFRRERGGPGGPGAGRHGGEDGPPAEPPMRRRPLVPPREGPPPPR